jgi:PAS domain-containing protein
MFPSNDSFPVIKVDSQCTIVDCNTKACEFFGLKIEEIQGKKLSDYLDADCGLEGSFSGESEYIINRFHHYTGSISDVVIARNRDPVHEKQFLFLTIFDISFSGFAADNTKSESIKSLAGRMAHDFNNILAGILGSLSILREGDFTGNEYDELINNAEDGVIRARKITDKMLLFSRGGVNPVPDIYTEPSHLIQQDDSDHRPDGERLLLLDDNPFVAGTTIGMLVTLGYIVDVVSEGRDILEKYMKAVQNGDPYKVVIMDLTIDGGLAGLR